MGGHKFFGLQAADLRDNLLDQARRAGRRCRFQHAEAAGADDAADLAGGGLDKAHIGHALFLRRLAVGRLDGDDEDIRRFRRGGEVQAAGGHGFGERVLQTGLDNVDLAPVQNFYGFRLDVEATDFVACEGEGDGGGQADIAAAHNFNLFHSCSLLFQEHHTLFFTLLQAELWSCQRFPTEDPTLHGQSGRRPRSGRRWAGAGRGAR